MASFSEEELVRALDGDWRRAAELAQGKALGEEGLVEYVRLLNDRGTRIETRELEGRREYRLVATRTP